MAYDSMMGDEGKVKTDAGTGPQVEQAVGKLKEAVSQMNEVLQMLGPDTAQQPVKDKMNPAETKGDPKMSDPEKQMKRGVLIASLKAMK